MFNSTKGKLGQARNSHNKQTKAPLTQLHDADLYIICWIIVNVFRARMCAWYLPKGMKQEVLSNALPREQGVYWIIWSLIISLKNIPVAQQCNQYFPDNDKNSVKMHLNQSINVYLSTTTHRIFQATKADRQSYKHINNN